MQGDHRCQDVGSCDHDPLRTLLPHLRDVRVDAVTASGGELLIEAATTTRQAPCPDCGTVSTHVHGHYQRRLQDTPHRWPAHRHPPARPPVPLRQHCVRTPHLRRTGRRTHPPPHPTTTRLWRPSRSGWSDAPEPAWPARSAPPPARTP